MEAAQVNSAERLEAAVQFCKEEDVVSLQELASYQDRLIDSIRAGSTLGEVQEGRLREQLDKHMDPWMRMAKCWSCVSNDRIVLSMLGKS